MRVALEVGVALLVFLALSAWQTRRLLPTSGEQAPDFQLRDLSGNLVSRQDFDGRATLIHFWATWCGVCRQELSALNWLYQRLGPDEALVTIVADSEDPGAVRRFVRDNEIRYPVLLATPEVLERYRVSAFPTNYYLDGSGGVQDKTVGLSTRFSMDARLGCAK